MKITFLAAVILSIWYSPCAIAQSISFENSSTLYLEQMYTSPVSSEITISGYPNETITSPDNLSMASIMIEQSCMESLEVWIECPNGSRAVLINSYDGDWGTIPGGVIPTSWGGTYLGDPTLEDVFGTPGMGWEYSFSTTQNTMDNMATELVNENFVPATEFGNGGNSMNPNGVYLPDSNFDELVGCPVDGVWKLFIQDNVDFNNGTLFGWSIDLDIALNTSSITSNEKSINVFPNPGTSSIYISVPMDLMNENYVLIDQLGTVLLRGQTNSLETAVDVSSLKSGLYFIRVGESKSGMTKFMKQ